MGPPNKNKKPRRIWSDWGDWIWSEKYKRYYRQRQDTEGNIDTHWAEPAAQESVGSDGAHTTQAQQGDDIDELAEDLEQASIDSGSYQSGSTYQSERASTRSSNTEYSKSSRSRDKKDPYTRPSKEKGKSKAAAAGGYEEDQIDEEDTYHDTSRDRTSPRSYQASAESGAYRSYGPRNEGRAEESTEGTYYGDNQGYTTGGGYEDEREEAYDDDMQRAVNESRSHARYGESSTAAAYTSYSGEYEDEPGQQTPRAGPRFDISGKGGEYEELDPRYRVEHSSKFQPGEASPGRGRSAYSLLTRTQVFKILWSEPSGVTVGGTPTISDKRELRDSYGQRFFVGFRRFIVIANDSGHSTCVPILTYGNKGCKKKGIKPEKHGIIVQTGHKARRLDGEPDMGFHTVHLRIEADGEKLARESRVNYSKLVTVEHNVKVFFIGCIAPDDWQIVSDAVNKCWEEKVHSRRKNTKY